MKIPALWAILLTIIITAMAVAFGEPISPQAESSLITTALINQKAVGTFIIDTGSTYAVITPDMARSLGVVVTADNPRVNILTANGFQSCPRVTLASVTVGPVKVQNVAAVVKQIDDDPLLAGLLGMSFLSQVDLRINRGTLTIRKAGE